jgi:3-oxoacyl-[acyl-carrier-protein] synthase-3
MLCSIIKGTGSYIPEVLVKNTDFLTSEFYDSEGQKIESSPKEIIEKFHKITNISERRYVTKEYVTSDIAAFAAANCISSANIDKETIDYIIVAHNFGDVKNTDRKSDIVPSLASRVKYKLNIKNAATVAYDIIFGCPGWLQALIQANYYLKSGDAKRVLVIGAEVLSRVSDPHDRDSMLYSDGAGAVLLEAENCKNPKGVLAYSSYTYTDGLAYLLGMGRSYKKDYFPQLFLKMNGRKLYEFALTYVPTVVKECIDKAKLKFNQIKKILLHQANEKMDVAILQRLFALFSIKEIDLSIMPMTIDKLGNNSVATLPILLDLILKGQLENHKIEKGDNVVFASVGAGMNINAVAYRF